LTPIISFLDNCKEMPCACQIPVPSYPDTADWGPILWTILHGMAEKSGKSIINADEVREWQKFIRLTGEMLPCDICRQHYIAYFKENPTSILSTIPFTQLHETIKKWFWTLHNDVNIRNNKPIFTYDDLETRYGSVDLTDQLYRLTPVIKTAIQLSGVPYMKWTAWISSFKMLRANLAF